MAKPTAIDFSKLPSLTEVAEGGGFGPSSFRGYPIAAAFMPHRYGKEFKPNQNASYFVALWVKFHVDEVLDTESGWDPDDHDQVFDYYWKAGSKSLNYFFPTNDGINPAGVEKDGAHLSFEALDLMAAGRVESGGLVTFDGEPESLHGRWLFPRPNIPDSKTKLEGKSGLYLSMKDSAPAVEAVDPELVITAAGKKPGDEVKVLNIYKPGPDGLPLGAEFWVGLNGVWDTKKITLEIKDKATGQQANVDQKYLFLTTFDGRVEVEDGGTGEAEAQTKTTTPTTAKKSSTTKKSTPPPASESDSEPESLDVKINRLILSSLPDKGAVTRQVLALAVVRDSGEFAQKEAPAAMTATNRIITSAPDKAGAKELAEAGMEVEFVYDPQTQKVERFNA